MLFPTDNLRATLVSTIEQLNIARKTCDDLQVANARLKAESTSTGKLMHEVFRKLLKTSDYADAMPDDAVRVESQLLQQEPQLSRLRKELNGFAAQIKAFKAMDARTPSDDSESAIWQRCRQLEEGQGVLQRQLETANARNADLQSQNNKLSRQLQLANYDDSAADALAKAKEDIEWYEGKTIQQQEKIFDLRHVLGLARTAKREMRAAYKVELHRMREDYDASIEALQSEHNAQLAAFVDEVNASYREKFAEWKKSKREAVEAAVAAAKLQYDLEKEDSIHETVMERLEERRRETLENLSKREKEWKDKIAEVKMENKVLLFELEDLREFMDTEIEKTVAKRLSAKGERTQQELVKELRERIDEVECQRREDQRVYQDRLQEAVIEGWRLSSEEKVQELLEAFDQMKEDLEACQQSRDALMDQVLAYQKTEEQASEAIEDAAELRQIVAENDKQIEEQEEQIRTLAKELTTLRPAHEKVLAAQDAAMEANIKHQRDLQMARNQVDTLVDQVSALEDHIESLRMARSEADKMHKMLLEAETQKTREALGALDATRDMLSPIQEEQLSEVLDVSSEETSEGNDTITQRVSRLFTISHALGLEYKLTTSSFTSSWPRSPRHIHRCPCASSSASTPSRALKACLQRCRHLWRRIQLKTLNQHKINSPCNRFHFS